MNYTITKYSYLHDDAKRIRTEVFLNEQKFSVEFDDTDNIATHLVLYIDKNPAAVCRYFFNNEKNCYMIGRVAVDKKYRGQNLGSEIMKEAEKLIIGEGGSKIALSAQCRVRKFYENLGYYPANGENVYLDEYCPHILLEKNLK